MEAFEKWAFDERGYQGDDFRLDRDGTYYWRPTLIMWEAWQAALDIGYRAGFRAASGEVEQ